MADKDIRRMNRQELLELLVERTRQNQDLQAQLSAARRELEQVRSQPTVVEPPKAEEAAPVRTPEQIGSLAEEAFRVSGILEAAQKSASYYLKNVERIYAEQTHICERVEAESRAKAAQLQQETEQKCRELREDARAMVDALLSETKNQCAKMEADARERAERLKKDAEQDCERMERAARERAEQLCAETAEKCDRLEADCAAKNARMDSETRAKCAAMEAESREKAEQLLGETRRKCEETERETQARCKELQEIAERSASCNWEAVACKLDEMRAENAELREQLLSTKKKRW